MNKLMFLAVIAMVLTVFNSCQKNGIIDNTKVQSTTLDEELRNIGFSVDDNCLVLESEEEFQKLINYLDKKGDGYFPEFEKAIGFDSYRLYYNNNPGRSEKLEDDLIATIINPEAKISIGNYSFKVDFENEKIEVYSLENNASKCLKSASVSGNESAIRLNWEDDVFAILKHESILKSSSYCNNDLDEKYNRAFIGWADTIPDSDDFWYDVQAKLCYQNLGFIHTIISKCKITNEMSCNNHGVGPTFRFFMDITGYYDRKGEDRKVIDKHIEGDLSEEEDEISYRPFYGTRRVQKFNISSDFTWEALSPTMRPYENGETGDFTTLNISCKDS